MEFELMTYMHAFYKWIDGVLIFLYCFSEWFTTLVSQSNNLHHLNVNVCKFMFKISVIPDFVYFSKLHIGLVFQMFRL